MKNSNLSFSNDVVVAAQAIQRGDVIAYPTEAVYGLGCDPFNETAVRHLLAIKKRPVEKGLIVVASDWQQVQHLTQPLPTKILNKIFATWPGPHTWVFPATEAAPKWITGNFPSIAIRISDHPIVQALCKIAGPIVSTSANISNSPAAKTPEEVGQQLGEQLALILVGELGGLAQPTMIRDALTDKVIRSA